MIGSGQIPPKEVKNNTNLDSLPANLQGVSQQVSNLNE
jgi:hypothetical protein